MMERIALLRNMEASCYGACVYLLEDENRAAEAAQEMLKRLFYDEEFWRMCQAEQERKIRREAVSYALGGLPKNKKLP